MNNRVLLKCRLCLDPIDSVQTFELFTESERSWKKQNNDNEQNFDELKLFEKVEYCCGIRIRESPEMPSKICIKCFDITRIWFNFRQMAVNSQVYLESICSDRQNPNEVDENDENAYLNYLLEDVQTFRMSLTNSRTKNSQDEAYYQYEDVLLPEETDSDETQFISHIENKTYFNENEIEDINYKDSTDSKVLSATKTKQKKSLTASSSSLLPVISNSKKLSVKIDLTSTPTPNSFMCSVCGNVYTKKSSFNYHMSLHSNKKPHECEICGKGFRQISELKNHIRRHTGEKPYKCSHCDRCFIDRSERHRHERGAHTNSRPYVCSVCGKSFAYSAILKNHSKLHSGQKDFHCLVCDKSFSLKHQLKSHLQTLVHKHKEEITRL